MSIPVIERPYYLQRLAQYRENGLIKVILGPRRCGKSFLLEMHQTELRRQAIAPNRIVAINLDDFDSRYLRDAAALHQHVLESCPCSDTYYVFIDEIQMCSGFQDVLSSLSRRKNLDMYVTGSNAFLLSGELATLLTGRYTEIRMSALSFAEFHKACEKDGLSAQEDLFRYMQIGGFPAVVPYRFNSKAIQDYYDGLVSSIIVKDICYRLKIRDAALLDRLTVCLATDIGSAISPKNLMNTLKHEGMDISLPTVYTYLQALEDSFFFHRVPRFDIRGKAALRSEEKFYLCDTGFRYSITSTPVKDYGRMLENIVYLELVRRYKKVRVGQVGHNEVDFVAESSDGYVYFQVAMSVLDPVTLERELAPLKHIRDAYPKYLITADAIGEGRNFEGIKQINAAHWLLNTGP